MLLGSRAGLCFLGGLVLFMGFREDGFLEGLSVCLACLVVGASGFRFLG